MKSSFSFSYETVSEILSKYFQKEYEGCSVYFNCSNKKEYNQDSYGFVDEELVLWGALGYSKKTKVFGEETEIGDIKFYHEKEIVDAIKSALNEVLDQEGNNLEVKAVSAGERCVYITVGEKEKRLVK